MHREFNVNSKKTWAELCRSWHGSYWLALAVSAFYAYGMFPQDAGGYGPHGSREVRKCPVSYKVAFVVLQMSSLGTALAVSFLWEKIGASSHARLAFAYAVVNWFQALAACTRFSYNADCEFGNADNDFDMTVTALPRLLLYLICMFMMQYLIAARLELLEQTSRQKYCSACFRMLVRSQVLLVLCAWLVGDHLKVRYGAILVSLICNIITSAVAICSLTRSLTQLRRLLQLAKRADAPIAVRSLLKRARSFAVLQATGVSFSLMLTVLVLPAACLGWSNYFDFANLDVFSHEDMGAVTWVIVFVQAFDLLGNVAAVVLPSGSHRLSSKESQASEPMSICACPISVCPSRPMSVKHNTGSPAWQAKVEELSLRGMTLRSILQFYQDDLPFIPSWGYAPREHKTRDVVRRAIIPLTSAEECSYAGSALNRDGARRAQVMVTHNWGNCFKDLLAAVVSDALNECSFNLVAKLLEEDCTFVFEILNKSGRLDDTYWICAFAVNQHMCICHCNPYDRDPFTNQLHPVCNCSSVNISDPDGRSTESEINKFDDMMYNLAATGGCRQVIAADQSLDLFNRAWCIAEIAEANRLEMSQALKLASRETIMQHALSLEDLDVRNMRASSEADKQLILKKIRENTSIDEFNAELKVLIFDPRSGLLASWKTMDGVRRFGEVGHLIRWGLLDAGTGKVWKAWEAHE